MKVNNTDKYKNSALLLAAGNNDDPEVIKLLVDAGADVNAVNDTGWTALMFAAHNANSDAVRILIDAGADVNAEDEYYGKSVLFWGVEGDANPEIIKRLVDAGADVNAVTERGENALMRVIAASENIEILQLLLDAGADVQAGKNHALLLVAQSSSDPEIVRMLVGVSAEDVLPAALKMASRYNDNPEIIQVLLDAGADVNERDEYGNTPLMDAASGNENHEVLRLLINAGADVNAVDDGYSVLMDAAIYTKNPEILIVLLDAGADPSVKRAVGGTAWDFLQKNKNLKDMDLDIGYELENRLTGAPLKELMTGWTMSVEGLELRAEADPESSSLGPIPYGTEVEKVNSKYPWVKIRWEGKKGWVNAGYLSYTEVESRSVISEVAPSADLFTGMWFTFEPFCLEARKFTGGRDFKNYTIHSFSTGDVNRYGIGYLEGGASGEWTLAGDEVDLQGERGYEESYKYTEKWRVAFYKIREDWLVLKIVTIGDESYPEESRTPEYILRPPNARSENKVRVYFPEAFK